MDRPELSPMYWTISTTEMTERQAHHAADFINTAHPSVHAFVLDPRDWFTLSLDRWTAELLRDALHALASMGGHPAATLQLVEDWLANQAHPYPSDTPEDDRYRKVVP